MKQFLQCGRITSTHGIKGEVRVEHWCDSADFFCSLEEVFLEEGKKVLEVENSRPHKNIIIAKFKGYDSIEDISPLRGKIIYINRETAESIDNEGYFIADLIGVEVKDADSDRIWGKLTDVFQNGSKDVYEITDSDGTKRLIPAIDEVVINIDIESEIMTIRPLEGLFDEN